MIKNLADQTFPYLTLTELATYWGVSRKLLYKQIHAGTLHAIRLGPRLLRVSVKEAARFEADARLRPAEPPAPPRHAPAAVAARPRRRSQGAR
jgi:excisionase family DNA binding protein